jgi:uncharacterized membrane protein YgcG
MVGTPEEKPAAVAMSAQPSHSQKYLAEHTGLVKPYGAYRKMVLPFFAQVWFYVTMVGVIASIICFCRLAIPVPEQVAGSNAVRDRRNEARTKQSSKTSRSSSNSNSYTAGVVAGTIKTPCGRNAVSRSKPIIGFA